MLFKFNILRMIIILFGLYKIYKNFFLMRFVFGVLRKFEFIKEIYYKLNMYWFMVFL